MRSPPIGPWTHYQIYFEWRVLKPIRRNSDKTCTRRTSTRVLNTPGVFILSGEDIKRGEPLKGGVRRVKDRGFPGKGVKETGLTVQKESKSEGTTVSLNTDAYGNRTSVLRFCLFLLLLIGTWETLCPRGKGSRSGVSDQKRTLIPVDVPVVPTRRDTDSDRNPLLVSFLFYLCEENIRPILPEEKD